jgi:GNAT superfamily N-acetyltransferase
MNATYVISEIAYGSAEYRAELELRDAVLRRPLGRQLSAKDTEGEEAAFHLVCYLGERLVGCLVLRPLAGGDIHMRQVGVVPDMQRQGIGAALVNRAEVMARERGFCRMVLNARETAVPFYEKLGYARCGPRVDIVTIPHWEMEKRLDEGPIHTLP